MEILGIIGLILSILGIIFFDIPTRFREWRYSIYLTPKSISIGKGEWSTKRTVEIVNNNPYPIYSIQLKISEESLGTNIDNLQIKPEPYIISTSFNKATDVNAFVVSGQNPDKKKWKRSFIYKINPNTTISIHLTFARAQALERFKLRITDFSKESKPIHDQNPATYFNLEIRD